jgi:hypothetical protein
MARISSRLAEDGKADNQSESRMITFPPRMIAFRREGVSNVSNYSSQPRRPRRDDYNPRNPAERGFWYAFGGFFGFELAVAVQRIVSAIIALLFFLLVLVPFWVILPLSNYYDHVGLGFLIWLAFEVLVFTVAWKLARRWWVRRRLREQGND